VVVRVGVVPVLVGGRGPPVMAVAPAYLSRSASVAVCGLGSGPRAGHCFIFFVLLRGAARPTPGLVLCWWKALRAESTWRDLRRPCPPGVFVARPAVLTVPRAAML
jgi:hypothetical protein